MRSFISAFGVPSRNHGQTTQEPEASTFGPASQPKVEETPSPQPVRESFIMNPERSSSRPASMAFTNQPPLMDVAEETLPELLPIFTFLNSHSNKLYQEGYFLKLNDLDIRMWIRVRRAGGLG